MNMLHISSERITFALFCRKFSRREILVIYITGKQWYVGRVALPDWLRMVASVAVLPYRNYFSEGLATGRRREDPTGEH